MKYEYLKSDPKRPKKRYNGIVKQGTSEPRLVILKKTNKNLSKAVSIVLTVVLLATAFFIATKYIDGIEGEVVHTGTPVYALETVVEAPQPEIKEEVAVVPAVVEAPVVEPVVAPAVVVEAVVPTGDCSLAYNYAWPKDIAYQICLKESGGNPNAANWKDNHMSWAGCMGSFGLMQVNCSHGQLYDGVQNMKVAYSMYVGWGNSFRAWTTCAKVAGCK
jgi:hypothetical protein